LQAAAPAAASRGRRLVARKSVRVDRNETPVAAGWTVSKDRHGFHMRRAERATAASRSDDEADGEDAPARAEPDDAPFVRR